jgi:NAD(P)-dependent dehydrogenase (short-subunit alcohol dehydrogenase family)
VTNPHGGVVDVVVGAASGMGAAVAEALVRAAQRPIVLADRDVPALRSVVEATSSGTATEVRAVECDLTAPDTVADLAAGVPRLGSLIVTAGLSPTMADGERILAVNLVGMARLLDAFDPAVGEGSAVVCFASMAGHLVPPDANLDAALDEPLAPDLLDRLREAGVDPSEPGTAYGLSKRGVMRLVRRRSLAWGRRGGRINSISPGIIDTPMGRQELAQQPMMQPMIDASALGRAAAASEVASVAVFLCSTEASFVTGTDVLVDGGAMAAFG